MSQKCVGRQLGEFTAPQVGGQNTFFRHPISVDFDKSIDRSLAFAANQNTIGAQKVLDGRSFCKKLRIAEHVKRGSRLGVCQNRFDGLGCSYWQRRFFDNDFVSFGDLCNLPCALFDKLQVGGSTRTNTKRFGWRVDGDKNHVRLFNRFTHLGRKREVLASTFFDDF